MKFKPRSVEYGNRTKRDFHKLSDFVLWVEEQVPHLEDLDSTMRFVIQVLSRMQDESTKAEDAVAFCLPKMTNTRPSPCEDSDLFFNSTQETDALV